MEGQGGNGPLPFAALSLNAFAPAAVSQPRTVKPRQVVTPNPVPSIHSHDGPRSHPIVARLTAEVDDAESRPKERSKHDALTRLFSAVPAALGRLVNTPLHETAFASSPRLSDARVFPSAVRRRAASGNSGRPAGGGGRKAAVVWFRNDLRLHDNPALERASREGTSVLPVYVFDPRDYGKNPTGLHRVGPARARFILDAVADLRGRLRAAGSELVVRVGRPEEVLAELAGRAGAGAVYCQGEAAAEEAQLEGRVRARLERDGCELRALWGGTLYHLEDLPFRLDAMPTSYADFRSRVCGLAVRPVVDSEGALRGLPQGSSIEPGELPSLAQLGVEPATSAPLPASGSGFGGSGLPAGPPLRGGESEALRHLQAFMAELKSTLSRGQQHQAGPRGQPAAAGSGAAATGLGGGSPAAAPSSAFSCRISPWLALGCLSPRRMYHEMRQQLGAGQLLGPRVQPAAAAAGASKAPTGAAATGSPAGPANWLVFELLWRDFFRFVTQKYAAQTRAAAGGKAAKGVTVRAREGAAAAAAAPALAVA